MTKIKKITAAAIATTTMVISMGSMNVSGAIKSDNVTATVKTYSYTWHGTYSYTTAAPSYTIINSSNVNYNGSYKFAFEALHGESGGNLYYIDSSSVSGCDICIRSDLLTVTDEVARRAHISRIHYTSNPSSTVKDSFEYFVTKP